MEYKQEIRFIITNKCSNNCIFCHREGTYKRKIIKEVILPHDYQFIARTTERCLRINKFILTGGEPLLLDRVIEILKMVKSPTNKVNVITGGALLAEKSGIADIADEIHVSLGTLDEEQYKKRTQTKGQLKKIIDGIESVIGSKAEIKLNVVMLKEENITDDHLFQILEFAKEKWLGVYLIEIFPPESPYHFPFSEIEKALRRLGFQRGSERGIKVRYEKTNYPKVDVVFIPCSLVSSPLIDDAMAYCKANQAIYILPDLTIQPCFLKPREIISIKEAVKDKNEGELIKKIKLARAKIGCNCPLLK